MVRTGLAAALNDALGLESQPPISAAQAAAVGVPVVAGGMKAFASFFDAPGSQAAPAAEALTPARLSAPASSSFSQVAINFNPRVPELQAQSMRCENDMAVCNRECERLYGDRQSEMEEPCKLAVVQRFAGAGSCFPSSASVQERRRGAIRMCDVRVGDELAVDGDAFSRVVALLHDSPRAVVLYLRIKYGADDATGELCISPQHLLRVRRRLRQPVEGDRELRREDEWDWLASQDVRSGDDLEAADGLPLRVHAVQRCVLNGAFAPATATGTLLVDGVLCSCYAPPAIWGVPHSLCHRAMAPLRVLDGVRTVVEKLSETPVLDGRKDDPVLTLDAVWFLPKGEDPTIHPYASGLLQSAHALQSLRYRWKRASSMMLGGPAAVAAAMPAIL
eukprot:TRINITY_DN114275_c0_g1_i1.p1 TRINITY_DN114275_c0_g1~~TRINITY_DN114275_c0_g1_i1.p1  ORF type:complete len:391 (+),score=96.30 TRINITY_DN114275_c0_g1_i1:113-1285(+)